MRLIVWGVVALGLTACSHAAMVQTAFPDREMFSFATADGASVFTYACAPGDDAQSRAGQAHQFTDRAMT